MATATLVSIEEYLRNTSHQPNVEYIDGELKERPEVVRAHGLRQGLICTWFMCMKIACQGLSGHGCSQYLAD
jgi:hypothetical protein